MKLMRWEQAFFFVVYAFLGVPADLLMRKLGPEHGLVRQHCCGISFGSHGMGRY